MVVAVVVGAVHQIQVLSCVRAAVAAVVVLGLSVPISRPIYPRPNHSASEWAVQQAQPERQVRTAVLAVLAVTLHFQAVQSY